MTKVIRMIEAISRRHFSNIFRKDLRFETLFWSVIGYSTISISSISVDILEICFSHTNFDLGIPISHYSKCEQKEANCCVLEGGSSWS